MRLLNLLRKKLAFQQLQQQEAISASTVLIRELYQTGDYAATILACDRALGLDFTNSELYLIRGLAKCKLGDLAGAGQDLKQAAVFIDKQHLRI